MNWIASRCGVNTLHRYITLHFHGQLCLVTKCLDYVPHFLQSDILIKLLLTFLLGYISLNFRIKSKSLKIYHVFKIKQVIGAGETTQGVRALVAFSENLSSFSSTSGYSQPYVIPASGSPMLLPCVGICTHTLVLTCSRMFLHIIKNNEIKSLKRKFKILTFQKSSSSPVYSALFWSFMNNFKLEFLFFFFFASSELGFKIMHDFFVFSLFMWQIIFYVC